MVVYVTFEGEEHRIRVESRRNRIYVQFDEEPEERVDIAFYGNSCTFIRDNRVFHADVAGSKNAFTVWTPEQALNFEVETEYKRVVGQMRGQALESENRIVAKMPGKIVKIMAKMGQKVSRGDALMVMEAMKMENEIRSILDGEIVGIPVALGDTVDSGDLLIDLKVDSKE